MVFGEKYSWIQLLLPGCLTAFSQILRAHLGRQCSPRLCVTNRKTFSRIKRIRRNGGGHTGEWRAPAVTGKCDFDWSPPQMTKWIFFGPVRKWCSSGRLPQGGDWHDYPRVVITFVSPAKLSCHSGKAEAAPFQPGTSQKSPIRESPSGWATIADNRGRDPDLEELGRSPLEANTCCRRMLFPNRCHDFFRGFRGFSPGLIAIISRVYGLPRVTSAVFPVHPVRRGRRFCTPPRFHVLPFLGLVLRLSFDVLRLRLTFLPQSPCSFLLRNECLRSTVNPITVPNSTPCSAKNNILNYPHSLNPAIQTI